MDEASRIRDAQQFTNFGWCLGSVSMAKLSNEGDIPGQSIGARAETHGNSPSAFQADLIYRSKDADDGVRLRGRVNKKKKERRTVPPTAEQIPCLQREKSLIKKDGKNQLEIVCALDYLRV
jgi:hypothetical protein